MNTSYKSRSDTQKTGQFVWRSIEYNMEMTRCSSRGNMKGPVFQANNLDFTGRLIKCFKQRGDRI